MSVLERYKGRTMLPVGASAREKGRPPRQASDLPPQPARLGHPPLNGADLALVGAAFDAGMPGPGAGEARGQLGGLALAEARRRLAVVMAGGGLGAVDAA